MNRLETAQSPAVPADFLSRNRIGTVVLGGCTVIRCHPLGRSDEEMRPPPARDHVLQELDATSHVAVKACDQLADFVVAISSNRVKVIDGEASSQRVLRSNCTTPLSSGTTGTVSKY